MPAAPAPIRDPLDDTGEIRLPVAKLCILKSDLSVAPPGPDWEPIVPNPNEHEVFTTIPDVISRSSGAGRIDAFTLRINLGSGEDTPADPDENRAHEYLHLPAYNRQYEIRALDDEGVPSIVLAWGVESHRSVDLGDSSESVHVSCRLDDYLFGQPLNSYPTLDTGDIGDPDNVRVDVERPLVWNPEREVNGTPRVMSNLSVWRNDRDLDDSIGAPRWYFVVDPESLRTEESDEFQRTDDGVVRAVTTPSGWSIAEAALALCWWCNPDETWVRNPRKGDEIAAQFGWMDDAGVLDEAKVIYLKNQSQTYGYYLPKALDELLVPHGMGWYLEHSLEDPTDALDPPAQTRVTTIKFFRRGQGMKVSLKRAKSGVKTKLNTNVHQARVQTSIVDMANVVQCYGSLERREATFELKKAWPNADDALKASELAIGGAMYASHPHTGRKWVLDTAGDYIGLRSFSVVQSNYLSPDDVSQYFDPEEWDYGLNYRVGETVEHNAVYYLCLAANTDSAPTNNGATPPVSTNAHWQVIDDPTGTLATRRRVFLPCLSEKSRGDDGVSNSYVLEWFKPNAGIAAAAWSATVQYYRGQTVTYSGVTYVATEDNINQQPPQSEWELVGLTSPPAWDSETTYNDDDDVTYNGRRYFAQNGPHAGYVPSSNPSLWILNEPNYFGGKWVRYEGGFSVLEHECGILFKTPEIPGELWRLLQQTPPADRLRITCSIEGDRRVQGRAVRRDSSPNEQDVVLTLDLSDKFQDARICRGSKFYGTENQHCRNDTARILAYAQTVQEIEDCADYSFSILVEGLLHPELQIGMVVEKIDGIDVTLDANVRATNRPARYPQIVGLNMQTQMPQMCEVMLETFKQERPEVTF